VEPAGLNANVTHDATTKLPSNPTENTTIFGVDPSVFFAFAVSLLFNIL
jgi:hypothetical protein